MGRREPFSHLSNPSRRQPPHSHSRPRPRLAMAARRQHRDHPTVHACAQRPSTTAGRRKTVRRRWRPGQAATIVTPKGRRRRPSGHGGSGRRPMPAGD